MKAKCPRMFYVFVRIVPRTGPGKLSGAGPFDILSEFFLISNQQTFDIIHSGNNLRGET